MPDPSRRSFFAIASSGIVGVSTALGQDRPRPRKRVGVVGEIRYVGLPEELEKRASAAMPLRVGGEYSGGTLSAAIFAMKDVDSRLLVRPVDSAEQSGKWIVVVQVSLKPND